VITKALRKLFGLGEEAYKAAVKRAEMVGILEFPRFRGHLMAVPTGAAGRMFISA
jgi:hypothetical protein